MAAINPVRDGRRRRESAPKEVGHDWVRGWFSFRVGATGQSLETAERILRKCGARFARRGGLGHDYTRGYENTPNPKPIGRRRRGPAVDRTLLQHYQVWATREGWDQVRSAFGDKPLRRNGWKTRAVELSVECEERCLERKIDPDLVLAVAGGEKKEALRHGSEVRFRTDDGNDLVVRMRDDGVVATAFVHERRVGRTAA